MYYCYIDGCLISNDKRVICFTKSDEVSSVKVTFDDNHRYYTVTYPTGTKYSDIPSFCTPDEDKEITLEGEVPLFYQHEINGLTFTLCPTDKDQNYVFSCFIDYDTEEPSYEENDVGGWVIVPSKTEVSADQIVNLINSNSTLFHVTGTEFTVANILGADLLEKKVKSNWDNTTPYGNYQKLYVNEAEVITAFIKELKRSYPEIEFFPQSSERKNLGHETVFYRAALSRDRSERFNSIILQNEVSGRFYYTTIPMELFYQTNDVAQYSERRSTYLLHHFFMDNLYFNMVKSRGFTDRYGKEVMEPFRFAVYWDRDIDDTLVRADSMDGSGRDTYTLTIRCDLICTLIERTEEVHTIQDVLLNIYAHSYNE